MKLSAKQIALFGQVRVNITPLDSKIVYYTTLFNLYESGWWVTERYGTIITLVKPKTWFKDGFACITRRIVTDVNLESLDAETKIIADRQYAYYKNKLEPKKKKNEDIMSTLQPRD